MASVPAPYNRSPVPGITTNPEMAQAIDDSPVFSALAQEIAHDREVSAMRHYFEYHLTGTVGGQQTLPFTLLIEQGSDFKCYGITGSVFSFADTAGGGPATDFPIPNSAGLLDWAGRGLSFQITDTRTGRQLTSGMVAAECVLTPGYGQLFTEPMPFRYFFWRNSKLRFDVRSRDNALRVNGTAPENLYAGQNFDIVLHGFKIYTPE